MHHKEKFVKPVEPNRRKLYARCCTLELCQEPILALFSFMAGWGGEGGYTPLSNTICKYDISVTLKDMAFAYSRYG